MLNEKEKEQPRSEEVKYTESDMLAAFHHGRAYESLNSEGDIETAKILEKIDLFGNGLN